MWSWNFQRLYCSIQLTIPRRHLFDSVQPWCIGQTACNSPRPVQPYCYISHSEGHRRRKIRLSSLSRFPIYRLCHMGYSPFHSWTCSYLQNNTKQNNAIQFIRPSANQTYKSSVAIYIPQRKKMKSVSTE